jgi:hypothetical protein
MSKTLNSIPRTKKERKEIRATDNYVTLIEFGLQRSLSLWWGAGGE